MSEPIFLAKRASVRLGGHHVLQDVDFRVQPGEVVAVVGPSGAGKTTLLRLLAGMVTPDAGSLRTAGQSPASLGPRELRALRARMGFVHQDHALVPTLRVSQNVLAGRLGRRGGWASLAGTLWPRRKAIAEVHALLERVGIPEKLFVRTDQLSGGQRQRVAIARALYQEPAALLADEPVASVDPARGRDLLQLLTRLAKEDGLTLVASLHDLNLARALFPRVLGLREGRVHFDAPTGEVSEEDFRALYALEGLRADG